MKEFKIFYEFNNRKMYTIVLAKNEQDAKQQINNRLHFLEIKDITKKDNDIDFLKDLFGFK